MARASYKPKQHMHIALQWYMHTFIQAVDMDRRDACLWMVGFGEVRPKGAGLLFRLPPVGLVMPAKVATIIKNYSRYQNTFANK